MDIKKIYLTFLAIISFGNLAIAQTINHDFLSGKWQTEEKDVIEFYSKGDKFEGKIINSANKVELQKHPEIIGTVIFTGLQFKKNEYHNGSYLDLESQKKYPVKIIYDGKNRIKVTFGSGFFSETHVFNRLN